MTPSSSPSSGAELRNGDTFAGRYRVLEQLGTGGTSAVYKVQDLLVGEIISLKLIKPMAAQDAQLLANFKRELALARKISHRNVVRIYDIGEDRDTRLPFILMEYVEGSTLAKMLADSGRLNLTDFLPIFRQACEALQCVHSHNVVHRDIKPANLMFSQEGILKLMDFGIARYMGGDQTLGPAIGTPAYMSPEQLMRRPLTPAADIYSIGAMCFELLTGRKPFADLSLAVRCAGHPPQLRREAPHVPASLAKAIERCMEPDPASRFQSVKELMDATADAMAPPQSQSTTPLSEILPEDPPEPREALPLFLQLVYRVSKIHDAGQSHVELCPRNFKIRDNGEVDIEVHPPGVTQGTISIREPKYTPPDAFLERPGGSGREALVAADIYSLGFVFYEVLLGRKLFEKQFAPIVEEETDFAWLKWHGDPEQKARPVKELTGKCPTPLSELVARMMEKRVDKRVKSMAEVIQTLQAVDARLEDTQKVEVEDAAAVEEKKAVPGRPRRSGGLVVGAIVAAVLLVGAAMVWRQRDQLKQLVDLAQLSKLWPAKQDSTPSTTTPATSKDETPVQPSGSGRKQPVEQPLPDPLPQTIDTPTGAMMLIPEGEFTMGRNPDAADPAQPNELAASTVKLPAYYMDRTEVTNEMYRKFCNAAGRPFPKNPPFDAKYAEKKDHPVMNVSWQDARAFAAWAGKRLPTEPEWEKAARGADGRRYPWGSTFESYANLQEGGVKGPAAVGSFAFDFSPFGVLDMAGNVPEWVDTDGGPGRKIVRGGGFQSASAQATTTFRTPVPPNLDPTAYTAIGFRCAADPRAALRLR